MKFNKKTLLSNLKSRQNLRHVGSKIKMLAEQMTEKRKQLQRRIKMNKTHEIQYKITVNPKVYKIIRAVSPLLFSCIFITFWISPLTIFKVAPSFNILSVIILL